MFRKRLVVILFGVVLALAAASSATAQGRHAVGSAVKTVTNIVGISSDEGDQGNVDDGDQGNTDDGAVGNTDDGDVDNVDDGAQGNVDDGDQGNSDDGEQGS